MSEDRPLHVYTRLFVRLDVNMADHPRKNMASAKQDELVARISEFVQMCRDTDEAVGLAPWSSSDLDHPVCLANAHSHIPGHSQIAQHYFHSLSYRSQSTTLYCHMRLRHSVSIEQLLGLSNRPYNLFLYVDRLQDSERPCLAGFFVYSHWAYLESSLLKDAIHQAVTSLVTREIKFALYFKKVPAPAGMGRTFPAVEAMQVEADEADYSELKGALMYLYNKLKRFPLGIKMVFVPPPSRCADSSLPVSACQSQDNFLKLSRSAELSSFRMVDLLKKFAGRMHSLSAETGTSMPVDSPPEVSIFDILMGFRLEGKPVFHSVLPVVGKRGFRVHCVVLPGAACQEVLRIVSQSPVAFFREYFAESVMEDIFDAPSRFKGLSESYDAVNNRIVDINETEAKSSLLYFEFDSAPPSLRAGYQPGAPQRGTRDDYSFAAKSFLTHTHSQAASSGHVRFAEAHRILGSNQVPGTPGGVTGERP